MDIWAPARISDNLIEILKAETGRTRIRSTTRTRALVSARLVDGYTEEDLERVVRFKCDKWRSDRYMKNHLTLNTLLNPDLFPQYHNTAVEAEALDAEKQRVNRRRTSSEIRDAEHAARKNTTGGGGDE